MEIVNTEITTEKIWKNEIAGFSFQYFKILIPLYEDGALAAELKFSQKIKFEKANSLSCLRKEILNRQHVERTTRSEKFCVYRAFGIFASCDLLWVWRCSTEIIKPQMGLVNILKFCLL